MKQMRRIWNTEGDSFIVRALRTCLVICLIKPIPWEEGCIEIFLFILVKQTVNQMTALPKRVIRYGTAVCFSTDQLPR